jgi:hypothetical protein
MPFSVFSILIGSRFVSDDEAGPLSRGLFGSLCRGIRQISEDELKCKFKLGFISSFIRTAGGGRGGSIAEAEAELFDALDLLCTFAAFEGGGCEVTFFEASFRLAVEVVVLFVIGSIVPL